MRSLDNLLKKKTINYKKLEKYGFINNNGIYTYKTKIKDNQFEIIVQVENNKMTSMLRDVENESEYVLVDIEDAVGKFVGEVREEYENKLNDIINKCTITENFKSKQAKEVIRYIKEKYGDELEFLWEKFDDNAIWRNKENEKWYGLLLTISKRKLGIDSDEIVEAIDLRYQKDEAKQIVDNEKFFLGYHMNKNSWITIKLDDTVDIKTIYDLIDNSYNLSISKK